MKNDTGDNLIIVIAIIVLLQDSYIFVSDIYCFISLHPK